MATPNTTYKFTFDGPVYDIPGPSYLLPFERDFDILGWLQFFQAHWTKSFHISAVYLAIIFSLRKFMEHRKPFELRNPLIVWNWVLAFLSLLPVIRGFKIWYTLVRDYNVYTSICSKSFLNTPPLPFWGFVFGMLKVVELGDTLFLVLRKKHISFLHVFHHVTVLIYCWFTGAMVSGNMGWIVVMNYAVHVFMYTYFAVRAMGYSIPKQVAMFVTLMQISQMAAGIFFHLRAYRYLAQGLPCAVSYSCVWYAFLLYTSYFFLFVNFFIRSYLKSGGKWSVRHFEMHKPMIGKDEKSE